jgi:hypothetical protein
MMTKRMIRRSDPQLTSNEIIDWLLEGDVSIQYQTKRDLIGTDRPRLQKQISSAGWGSRILELRRPDGHWGRAFYQPKWTSTHYTLLELRTLCLPQSDPLAHASVEVVLSELAAFRAKSQRGRSIAFNDVCVNGMLLNYAAYFCGSKDGLRAIVDFLLAKRMQDGGFNCMSDTGAKHSSVHTTLSVLEGLEEFVRLDHHYRNHEIRVAQKCSEEFLLAHHLFRSIRTGEIIDKKFLRLAHPSRWRYDILRALD